MSWPDTPQALLRSDRAARPGEVRHGHMVVAVDPLTRGVSCFGPYLDRDVAQEVAEWIRLDTKADPAVAVTVIPLRWHDRRGARPILLGAEDDPPDSG